MKDCQLWSTPVENKAFVLVKVMEDIKPYIIHSHTIAFVPLALVKAMLGKEKPTGKWARWLEKIQEFEIDVKPMNISRG